MESARLVFLLLAIGATLVVADMYCIGNDPDCGYCYMFAPDADTMSGGLLVSGTTCYATGGYIGVNGESTMSLFSSFSIQNDTDGSLAFMGYADMGCQVGVADIGAGPDDTFQGYLNVAGTALSIRMVGAC